MKESEAKFQEYLRQTTSEKKRLSSFGQLWDLVFRITPIAVVVGVIVWIFFQSSLPKEVFSSEEERRAFIVSVGEDPEKRVITLVTSWCPACKAMEASLAQSEVPFVRLDIEQSPLGRRLYDRSVELTGARGIPQVVVDRTWVGHSFSSVLAALNNASKRDP
jgi:glutaredoxin